MVTYNTTQQQAKVPTGQGNGQGNGQGGQGGGRGGHGSGYNKKVPAGRHGHKENGAGM
jgi:hypothetical protein